MAFWKSLRRSSSLEPASNSCFPLLQLPVELVTLIASFLTLDEKASLALTCHALLSILGKTVFSDLSSYPPTFKKATAESYLLRGLERDRNDPSLYVCYRCRKFHHIQDANPQLSRMTLKFNDPSATDVGFPICGSAYMEAIRGIQNMLSVSRKEIEPKSWTGSIVTPVHMGYHIESGISSQDLFSHRRFVLQPQNARYDTYWMIPHQYLLSANLEICPHVYFGWDSVTREGTICDALDEFYAQQHEDHQLALSTGQTCQPEPFTGYVCEKCMLEVDIRFRTFEVWITVWQWVGALKSEEKEKWGTKLKKRMGREACFQEKIKKTGLQPGDLKCMWENIRNKDKGSGFVDL
ncbi:hypothetical protein M011DRAFT_222323 [Sporormia fimetaria CBS 119925]|uniref:F-box domain-containing protein n=1 Tax=Sporormia fimetaria CBS 119925 TaxID=1340428 RepID=A0A6A6V0H9_9PLEO|nr:hypothetical protein M011DRAFT_222323 [Sporormia fimetaria CBS 119925]